MVCRLSCYILIFIKSMLYSPSDIRVPSSLSYHLADIYNEELDRALTVQPSAPCSAPLASIITPFLVLAAQTPTATTHKRIQSALLDPLLSALSAPPPRNDQPPSKKRVRPDADAYPHITANACFEDPDGEGSMDGNVLRKKLLRKVFEVASEAETKDANRRKMYKLWKDGNDEDEDL